jgi:ribosomal-protein-alanine N-acetyltransferase
VTTILETKRLLLREFVLDDLPEFFGLVSDPDVTRYTGDGCKTLEEARQGLIERPLRDYRVHGFGRRAVVFRPTGKVIGFAGLKYLDDSGEVDLGYRFFKEFWGQGLATEASRAVLDYGITVLTLQRIVATADIANKASLRVLERIGMRFEKTTMDGQFEVARYAFEQ